MHQSDQHDVDRQTCSVAGQIFRPSGFFVIRTPLLPFAEITAWSKGLTAAAQGTETDDPAARLQADRELIRARLTAALERPEVAEAIFLASPDLEERQKQWRRKPDSKKGRRVERALARYYLRMAGRATPFGLFAGCSVGQTAETTQLELAARSTYGRCSRLDMDYLASLTVEIEKDPALRNVLKFYPNTSLYDAADRLRYAESRLDEKGRSHHLVAVEKTEYLTLVLDTAAAGTTLSEIADALVDSDPEIERDEADGYLQELVDSQLLVSELSLPVTGPDPMADLVKRLAAHPVATEAAGQLRAATRTLQDFDDQPLGIKPEKYRAFAAQLDSLPAEVKLRTLIQVDMIKPVIHATLGTGPLKEILRGVELIHKLSPGPAAKTAISQFSDNFQERYESREIPLAEVLDEETGIGFMRSNAPAAEGSPLLVGLPFTPSAAEETTPWRAWHDYLMSRLFEIWSGGADQLVLEAKQLERFFNQDLKPLPDAFSVLVSLAAKSEAALNRGDFQLLFKGGSGPPGARLLGRFCHLSSELRAGVESHLRAEERLRPDVVFAEIVHLPEGRVGNILFRPVMREYEIPFLCKSGVPREQQIPITDLLVSVSNGHIRLRSRRLGKEIIPRLTNAHNFIGHNMGLYRFLASLQMQGISGGVNWSWGAFESAPFLPRVTSGSLVLSRARWRVSRDEIEKICKHDDERGFTAVQHWREQRRIPRLIEVVDADNSLPLDLNNVLHVDVLVQLLKNRPSAILREIFPDPESLPVLGPEGTFTHELVVPFERVAADSPPAAAEVGRPPENLDQSPPASVVPRQFLPGSEWLFAKLYCGTSNADLLLREVVGPLVRRHLQTGAVKSWFFIRYADPNWHLRLRLLGDPDRLMQEVLPALHAATAPLLDDGRLWQLQIDSYRREMERYGGTHGIKLSETLFQADSEAVLSIVQNISGDAGLDLRWRLTLLGIDMFLDDLGFDLPDKLKTMEIMQRSFLQEFNAGKALKKQLGLRFRLHRKDLEQLLASGTETPAAGNPGVAALWQRRQVWTKPIAELRVRAETGRLTTPLTNLATSFAHMHANRLLRSAARAQELVIYDLLCRTYGSLVARVGKGNQGGHA